MEKKNKKPGILKIVGIIVGILILAYVIGNFASPRTLVISENIEIEAAAPVVFEQVNELKNWEDWSPWLAMDPSMKLTYGDPSSGAGAWYSWVGEESGAGKLVIKESTLHSSIQTEIWFAEDTEEPQAFGNWTFEEKDGVILATWAFKGDFPWYQRIMIPLLFKKMLSEQYVLGLEKLKEIAEAAPKELVAPVAIEE